MLLHPTTGEEAKDEWQTFDGQWLRLQRVRVVRPASTGGGVTLPDLQHHALG